MDTHRSRYQLAAMACFLVAAKYEEAEENIPNAATLNQYASSLYETRLIHQMEVLLLTWCVFRPPFALVLRAMS